MSLEPRVEVLSVVCQVRATGADDGPSLCVLLRPSPDDDHRAEHDRTATWALPGGAPGADETLSRSARGLLAQTTGLTDLAHLEQLSVFSEPDRVPGGRTIASTYLGLVRSDVTGTPSGCADWFAVDALPPLAFDHQDIVVAARQRLAAKLSYTNIAFALAPSRFPMSELSDIYCAALGYPVDTTNLLRILSRRAVVVSTGMVGRAGRSGGRPPVLYRFADDRLRVTDEFATLRPPP